MKVYKFDISNKMRENSPVWNQHHRRSGGPDDVVTVPDASCFVILRFFILTIHKCKFREINNFSDHTPHYV